MPSHFSPGRNIANFIPSHAFETLLSWLGTLLPIHLDPDPAFLYDNNCLP
jgi:hypothetical protein